MSSSPSPDQEPATRLLDTIDQLVRHDVPAFLRSLPQSAHAADARARLLTIRQAIDAALEALDHPSPSVPTSPASDAMQRAATLAHDIDSLNTSAQRRVQEMQERARRTGRQHDS